MKKCEVQAKGSEVKKLVILGHTGFIGRAVLEAAHDQFPSADICGYGSRDIDLTDQSQANRLAEKLTEDTDIVMLSGIKKQHGDNLQSFVANLRIAENVARVLENCPINRLIYFSTADVYGEDIANTSISESTPVNPRSYYGIAKYAAECLLTKSISSQEHGSLLILRPPFTFGGSNDQSGIYGPYEFCRAACSDSAISVWGDGTELREFLCVDDLADLTMRLLKTSHAGVLNPVSGQSYSFKQILRVVESFVSTPLKLTHRVRTRGKVDNGFDNTRLRNWFPEFQFTPLQVGLRSTFDHACVSENEVAKK